MQIDLTTLAQAKTVSDPVDFLASFKQTFAKCHGEGALYDRAAVDWNDHKCVVTSSGRAERQHFACAPDRELVRTLTSATHSVYACRATTDPQSGGKIASAAAGPTYLFPLKSDHSTMLWDNNSAVFFASHAPNERDSQSRMIEIAGRFQVIGADEEFGTGVAAGDDEITGTTTPSQASPTPWSERQLSNAAISCMRCWVLTLVAAGWLLYHFRAVPSVLTNGTDSGSGDRKQSETTSSFVTRIYDNAMHATPYVTDALSRATAVILPAFATELYRAQASNVSQRIAFAQH